MLIHKRVLNKRIQYPSYSLHKKKPSCQSTRKKILKTSWGFLCLVLFFGAEQKNHHHNHHLRSGPSNTCKAAIAFGPRSGSNWDTSSVMKKNGWKASCYVTSWSWKFYPWIFLSGCLVRMMFGVPKNHHPLGFKQHPLEDAGPSIY